MRNILSFSKFFEEVYYDSRKEVEGYVDANDLVDQRLWFHTNRTHRNNGWNGMIGIYDTISCTDELSSVIPNIEDDCDTLVDMAIAEEIMTFQLVMN